MLNTIQVGRGLAALFVVLYHTWLIQYKQTGLSVYEGVSAYGFLGVNYFFALSGFIILLVHRKDLGRPERGANYIRRRAMRIYPTYWVYSAMYVLAAAAGLGSPDFSWDPLHMLQYHILFYFNDGLPPPPLQVAWTLFYEIRFYLVFVLLIFFRRAGLIVMAAWLLAIAAGHVFFSEDELWDFLSYWNISFFLGMAALLLYERIRPGMWIVPAAAGVLLLVAIFSQIDVLSIKDENAFKIIPIGIGFASLILAGALLDRTGRLRLPSWLLFLGDASYSVYLVHSGVISLLVIVLKKAGAYEVIPAGILFWPIFLAATLAGCAAYLAVEKPILRFFQQKRTSKSGAAVGLKAAGS